MSQNPMVIGPVSDTPEESGRGYRGPAAKPQNCQHGQTCCYGHGLAFCFPCYVKIMERHRDSRRRKAADHV